MFFLNFIAFFKNPTECVYIIISQQEMNIYNIEAWFNIIISLRVMCSRHPHIFFFLCIDNLSLFLLFVGHYVMVQYFETCVDHVVSFFGV